MGRLIGILVLLSVSSLRGIKLPGTCPSHNATHDIRDICRGLSTSGFVYVAVPFERRHRQSNFFNEYHIKKSVFHFSCKNVDEFICNGGPQGLVFTANWYKGDLRDSLYLNSSFELHTRQPRMPETPCPTTTLDTLKAWIDGQVMVFWSCVEYEDGNHDEALLAMTLFGPNYDNSIMNRSLGTDKVKETLGKYFKGPLRQAIDWIPKAEESFECPKSLTGTSVYIPASILVFVVVAILLWFISCVSCGSIEELN